MKKKFSNLDGTSISPDMQNDMRNGVIAYQMGEANLPLKGNPFDADNFYPANGVVDEDDEFYSEIFGLSKAERESKTARKDAKSKSKAEARTTKANAKQTKANAKVGLADAQKESAKALGKDTTAGDVALAGALGTPGADKPKSNTLIYVGIGVAVVGLAIFAYIKLKKK